MSQASTLDYAGPGPATNTGRLFLGCIISIMATSFGFITRAILLNDFGRIFDLTETQKGAINGAGLFPFAISIILLSLFIDRIGYGKTMLFAFIGHVVGVLVMISAQSFAMLYVGTFILALANGAVEAATNPAVATMFPNRVAGVIDVVGIANFVSFLENTESYRRDLRRAEYGDERDPAMREFLTKISPINNAQKIRAPLYIVHGRNDPRVPYTEAEQIVAVAKSNNVPVWYLLADNEGHGFAKKANADFHFYAMIAFLQETLLGK